MGHLVNAISTRLGWFSAWKDEIYLRTSENSDYVHHFIRIRLALVFVLFSREPWDEYCFISSHFNMLKKRRTVCVIIYVYTGKVMLFHEGFRQYYVFYAKRLSYALPKYFRTSFIHNLFVVRGIMTGIDAFGLKEYKSNATKINKITNSKRKKNYIALTKKYIYSKGYATDSLYGLQSFKAFMWLTNNANIKYNKVKLLRNFGLRWRLINAVPYWKSFRLLTEALFISNIYAALYSFMCEYFEYLITQVLFCEKSQIAVIFEFFLNDYVTPAFVTRYMLRKLAQNFTWRYVIDTMTRELVYIIRKVINKPVLNQLSRNKNRNSNNLYIYIFNYMKAFLNLYLRSFIHKHNMDNNIIKIFFRYTQAELFLTAFLMEFQEVLFSIGPFINIYNYNDIYLNLVIKSILYDFIYTFILIKYNNITQINWLYSLKSIFLAYYIVKFRFFRFNIKKTIFGFKNTSINSRFKKTFNSSFMEGFKFRMGGRLSRKQRASSFILTIGTVPLNTFSCNIEHAFFSAPLRNSELTIKLWFNKNTEPVIFQNYRRFKPDIYLDPLEDEEDFPDDDDGY